MLILTIRTDKPEAEVGLYQDHDQLAYEAWMAHRELSATLHHKIQDLLASKGKGLTDITGVVIYQGPGSFTGLRIGITVADSMAYGLTVPIVGVKEERDWIKRGIDRLIDKQDDTIVLPHYGAPVHITTPKH